MVMRFDSSDKMTEIKDDPTAAHIDQLHDTPVCQRTGIMASFNSLEDFDKYDCLFHYVLLHYTMPAI